MLVKFLKRRIIQLIETNQTNKRKHHDYQRIHGRRIARNAEQNRY